MCSMYRQIINTMFGDIVNKKIVDYFTTLTRFVVYSTSKYLLFAPIYFN